MTRAAVLVAALEPSTGVWTLMESLLGWLAQQPGVLPLAGVLGSDDWLRTSQRAVSRLAVPCFVRRIPGHLFVGLERYYRQLCSRTVDRWVASIEQRYGVQQVVVHLLNAWLSGAFVPVRDCSNRPVTTVTTFNGMGDQDEFRRSSIKRLAHRHLTSRLLRHRVKLVSVDKGNLELFHAFLGLPPESFEVVPNGIPDTGNATPRALGGAPFTVGYVGRLSESKGWALATSAVLGLKSAGVDVRLLIVGDGPGAANAESLADEFPETVEYLGFVSNAGRTVMPRLDALVLPSSMEGLPLSIMEAFASGVPVIATAVGGTPEMVTEGLTGFLVPRDVGAIGERIQLLATDQARHARMSSAARAKFVHEYDIEKVGRQYMTVYGLDVDPLRGVHAEL